ncbi:Pr6Pr family membrane protein [Paractinoplanes lichenicola]|uniref:Pr6Pr family membrane protein n=1 Tax=Paractinoplanes lichenicola TaxID=2802976 RepID=A0ABS1VUM1_9ACTN|nr:Pr6Pr family membrane protein [Actinoplanes lichenicola]MBL7258179.1 Pr6Pr family membrane protein [Actinoplanes lichenicola]
MRVWLTPQFWLRVLIVGSGLVGLLVGDHRIVYYTCQSNLITLGYFGGVLYWMVRRRTTDPAAPRLRGAVTLWIVITGLISHFMLQNGENPLPGLVAPDVASRVTNWSMFLVHYAVPLLVLADWILFGPRRVSPWRDLGLWILFPLAYGATSVARAILFPTVSARYPYFFLDPTTHGYDWVAGQFLELGVIFAVLGAALLGIDRLAARLRPTTPAAPSDEVGSPALAIPARSGPARAGEPG